MFGSIPPSARACCSALVHRTANVSARWSPARPSRPALRARTNPAVSHPHHPPRLHHPCSPQTNQPPAATQTAGDTPHALQHDRHFNFGSGMTSNPRSHTSLACCLHTPPFHRNSRQRTKSAAA
eukprot:358849-Chlamydomonas_euryale.AAC.3